MIETTSQFINPMRVNLHFRMVSLWFPYGFPMVFLWFSYGFPMVFLWFPYGFPMISYLRDIIKDFPQDGSTMIHLTIHGRDRAP